MSTITTKKKMAEGRQFAEIKNVRMVAGALTKTEGPSHNSVHLNFDKGKAETKSVKKEERQYKALGPSISI